MAELTGSRKLGDKLRESWGPLLRPAAALGRLCFAPSQGQQVRFTRPDTWLGGWTDHDPDAAMAEVTRPSAWPPGRGASSSCAGGTASRAWAWP